MSKFKKGDRVIRYNQRTEEEELGTVECGKWPILKVVPDDHILQYVFWHTSECDKVTDLLKKI